MTNYWSNNLSVIGLGLKVLKSKYKRRHSLRCVELRWSFCLNDEALFKIDLSSVCCAEL